MLAAHASVDPGTDVIQDALDDVFHAGGGSVNLSSGAYHQTKPIVLRTGVHLVGSGVTTVVGWANSVSDAVNEPLITNNGDTLEGVTIAKMKVRGPIDDVTNPESNDTPLQHGIFIDGDGDVINGDTAENSNVTIAAVETRNFGGHGIHIKGTDNLEIRDVYAHLNGMADSDLFHNMYLRRVRDAEITDSVFKSSPSGHGLRVGRSKHVYLGSSTITKNADHGVHISESTNLYLDEDMRGSDGNNYQVSDNGQNPHGGWRNFGVYTGATREWVDSSPIKF